MPSHLRTAVIGTGHLGREHARVYSSLAQSGQSRFVAVCDSNEAAGSQIAEKYGVEYFKDYRELLGKVDAVSVATPTESHAVISAAFLEAATDVLVEKPIAQLSPRPTR